MDRHVRTTTAEVQQRSAGSIRLQDFTESAWTDGG
jgi:hypothetical protein